MLPPRLPRSSVSFVYGRELIILQRFSALVFRCWPAGRFPPGDAMIVAAAQTSGARELLTEHLNHGQDYGGVRAVNPFLKGL
jgi:hypothetical protein